MADELIADLNRALADARELAERLEALQARTRYGHGHAIPDMIAHAHHHADLSRRFAEQAAELARRRAALEERIPAAIAKHLPPE